MPNRLIAWFHHGYKRTSSISTSPRGDQPTDGQTTNNNQILNVEPKRRKWHLQPTIVIRTNTSRIVCRYSKLGLAAVSKVAPPNQTLPKVELEVWHAILQWPWLLLTKHSQRGYWWCPWQLRESDGVPETEISGEPLIYSRCTARGKVATAASAAMADTQDDPRGHRIKWKDTDSDGWNRGRKRWIWMTKCMRAHSSVAPVAS